MKRTAMEMIDIKENQIRNEQMKIMKMLVARGGQGRVNDFMDQHRNETHRELINYTGESMDSTSSGIFPS